MRLTEELNFKRWGGGGSRKKQYRGGNCLKRGVGAWKFYRFKGGELSKKEGVVFLKGV